MNDLKNASPLLETAWATRYKMRLLANQKMQESINYKKKAERIAYEGNAVRNKFQSLPPWKARGLIDKNIKLRRELAELKIKENDAKKKADEMFLKSDENWIKEVVFVCGDIKIEWIKTETEGKACRLENGLYFSSADVAKKLKATYDA